MIAVALIMTYVIDSFAMSLRAVSIQTRKWTTSFANKFSKLFNKCFVCNPSQTPLTEKLYTALTYE